MKKGNLHQHVLTKHEGKKPFKCESCNYSNFHQKTTFNVPKFVSVSGAPQAPSYSSVVKNQVSPSSSGNGTAVAAYQPLTRGGNPNPHWGHQVDQNQVPSNDDIVFLFLVPLER